MLSCQKHVRAALTSLNRHLPPPAQHASDHTLWLTTLRATLVDAAAAADEPTATAAAKAADEPTAGDEGDLSVRVSPHRRKSAVADDGFLE